MPTVPSNNPHSWNIAQVAHWIRHGLPEVVALIPNATVSDVERLAVCFEEQEIAGFALFEHVDDRFLRKDCNVKVHGQRAAIIEAIKLLSQRCNVPTSQDGEDPQVLPTSLNTRPTTNTVPASREVIGSTTLKRKRTPSPIANPEASKQKKPKRAVLSTTPFAADTANGKFQQFDNIWNAMPRLTACRVLHGEDLINSELECAPSDDEDEDEFALHTTSAPALHRQFVSRCFKSMLTTFTVETVYHRGQPRPAFGPPQESPHKRVHPKDRIILGEPPLPRTFLLFRHGTLPALVVNETALDVASEDITDEVLSLYRGSKSISDVSSAFLAELEEEEEAEERLRAHLGSDEAVRILDSFVEDYIHSWRERKLPNLERTASKVWKSVRTRGSKGRSCLQGYKATFAHLQERLATLRRDILEHEWSTKDDMEVQCRILEPTLDDLAEHRWKIEVCDRPSSPISLSTKSHLAKDRSLVGEDKAADASPLDDFVVNDEEDSSRTIPENNLGAEDGSPPPGVTCYGDAASYHEPEEDIYDDDAASLPGENRSGIISDDDPLTDHLVPTGPSDTGSDFVMSDCSAFPIPSESAIHSVRTRKLEYRDARDASPEDHQLHNVVQKRNAIWPTTDGNTIIISSDSPESPEEYFAPPVGGTKDAEHASRKDLEEYSFDELMMKKDRKRVLSKLILSLEDSVKGKLVGRLSNQQQTVNYLQHIVLQYLASKANGSRTPANPTDIAFQFAKLFAVWSMCDPSCWDTTVPPDLWEDIDRPELDCWAAYTAVVLPKIAKFRKDGETIEVSSDDSDEPPKKRKRAARRSEKAATSRQVAAKRMEKFNESQQQPASSQLSLLDPQSEHGIERVLINTVKDGDSEQDVFLPQHLASVVKTHQIDGIRFLWRELTLSDQDSEPGACLAHTMGLGKTLQTIAFLATLKDARDNSATRKQVPKELKDLRSLILAPPTLLMNWQKEFAQWARGFFKVFRIDATGNDSKERLKVLRQWSETSDSVLLMGYQMFTNFTYSEDKQDTSTDIDSEAGSSSIARSKFDKKEIALLRKMLLEKPSIAIADEAHALRNMRSKTSVAVKQIRTQRRICLSGTPLNNNTLELFALLDWAAPGYLGDAAEFRERFARPIEEGMWESASASEKRASMKKLAVLAKETAPKIHRADITVLKGALRAKVEFVCITPLTEIQFGLYQQFVRLLTGELGQHGLEKASQTSLFGWMSLLTLLVNHPAAFRAKLMEGPRKPRNKKRPSLTSDSAALATITAEPSHGVDISSVDQIAEEHVSKLISESMVSELLKSIPDTLEIAMSFRMSLIHQILRLARKAKEQTLVFSSSIPTLDCLEALFGTNFRCGRFDGSMQMPQRRELMDRFTAGQLDVLFISTRAGGQGLNLQTASRVIIVDFGFNPALEEQAVGRAYRLGQQKEVFVYRFVSGGTFEEKLHAKTLFKSSLFKRVVDRKNTRRTERESVAEWLAPPRTLSEAGDVSEAAKDPLVLSKMIKAHSNNGGQIAILGLKTTETLQRDAQDEPLNDEERAEVEAEYKQRRLPSALRYAATAPPISTAPVSRGPVARLPVLPDTLVIQKPSSSMPAQVSHTPVPQLSGRPPSTGNPSYLTTPTASHHWTGSQQSHGLPAGGHAPANGAENHGGQIAPAPPTEHQQPPSVPTAGSRNEDDATTF